MIRKHPSRVKTCLKRHRFCCLKRQPLTASLNTESHVLFMACRPTHHWIYARKSVWETNNNQIQPGRSGIMWCGLFEPRSKYSWICWVLGHWGAITSTTMSASTGLDGEKPGQITPPSVSNIELQLIFFPSAQRTIAEHLFLSLVHINTFTLILYLLVWFRSGAPNIGQVFFNPFKHSDQFVSKQHSLKCIHTKHLTWDYPPGMIRDVSGKSAWMVAHIAPKLICIFKH